MRKILIVLFLFCFVFVNFAQAQKTTSKKAKSQKTKTTKPQKQSAQEDRPNIGPPPEPKNDITPEEEKEAKAFAELFIKRMRETRDLKPLIDELFISGFKDMAAQDEIWWGVSGMPYDSGKYIKPDERLNAYCNGFSIDYTRRLYMYSKIIESKLRNATDEEILNAFPPALVDYWKSTKEPENSDVRDKYISFVVKRDEQVLKLWREETIKNPPEETAQFKENLKNFEKHLEDKNNDWGQAFASTSTEKIAELPAGTRMIRLEIPFHIGLYLAKEKEHMKILMAVSMITD